MSLEGLSYGTYVWILLGMTGCMFYLTCEPDFGFVHFLHPSSGILSWTILILAFPQAYVYRNKRTLDNVIVCIWKTIKSNIVNRSIDREHYTYLSSKLWFLLIWTSILSVLGDSLLDDPKTSWVERILNEWGRLQGYACFSKIIIY